MDKIAEYKMIEERHGIQNEQLTEINTKINAAASSVAPSGDEGHPIRMSQLDTHINNTTS